MLVVRCVGVQIVLPCSKSWSAKTIARIQKLVGVRIISPFRRFKTPPVTASAQFHLRHLLLGVTGIGLLFGALRALTPGGDQLNSILILNQTAFSSGFALIGLVSLWATMGRGMLPLRIGAPMVTALIVGIGLSRLYERSAVVQFVEWTSLEMVVLAGTLGLFRYYGYRVEWRGGEKRLAHDEGSVAS
jgi:hypothetical protein